MVNHAANIYGRYATLINRAYDRFGVAVSEATAGTYTANRFASDAVLALAETVDAWWYPLKIASDLIPKVPFVVFRLPPSATGDTTTTPLFPSVSPAPTLTARDLNHDNTAVVPIPAASVAATVASGGDELTVTLTGLTNLVAGTYRGSVYVGTPNNVFAYVAVLVG